MRPALGLAQWLSGAPKACPLSRSASLGLVAGAVCPESGCARSMTFGCFRRGIGADIPAIAMCCIVSAWLATS